MNAAEVSPAKSYPSGAISLASALALTAAMIYSMIALGVLPTGDLVSTEGGAGIIYTGAICYLAGGLLIRLRWRWLYWVGCVLNGAGILLSILLNQDNPDLLFSPGMLAAVVFQLLLELTLIYLSAASWQRLRQPKVHESFVLVLNSK